MKVSFYVLETEQGTVLIDCRDNASPHRAARLMGFKESRLRHVQTFSWSGAPVYSGEKVELEV